MNSFKTIFLLLLLSLAISCSDSNDSSIDSSNGSTSQIEYSEVPPFYPIDFEAQGFGASWTWTVFENDDNPSVEIVDNPSKSGINTSSKVAKIIARSNGEPYAGCETKHGTDIGSFTFDATNKIVKMMVYKTIISDVGLKFVEASSDAQPEVKVANTKINEWEELTFDLSGSIGKGASGVIDQIVVFPDYQSRSSDHIIYFDYITFGE